jgi:lysine biosynthesis protein LysW
MTPAKKSSKPKVKCPRCGAEIELDPKTGESEIIECPDCACELEVVKKGVRFDVESIEERWREGEDLGETDEAEDLE